MVFGLVLISVLFIIFVVIAGLRNPEEIKNGGEDMIKNVFVYLVLFATLMMTIGGTVAAFMAIADMVAPAPYYQSFEEYKMNNGLMKTEIRPDDPKTDENKISDAELKTRYDAMVVSEKERNMDRAKNSLIKSMGWIVIPLPVFVYFQRRMVAKPV